MAGEGGRGELYRSQSQARNIATGAEVRYRTGALRLCAGGAYGRPRSAAFQPASGAGADFEAVADESRAVEEQLGFIEAAARYQQSVDPGAARGTEGSNR